MCQRLTFWDRLVQKERVSIPVDDLALVIEPYRQITQVSLKKEWVEYKNEWNYRAYIYMRCVYRL